MMQHQLLSLEELPPFYGEPIVATIATPRGVFTGVVDRQAIAWRSWSGIPQARVPDLVDIWHPVPRWMRPWQVIEPFLMP